MLIGYLARIPLRSGFNGCARSRLQLQSPSHSGVIPASFTIIARRGLSHDRSICHPPRNGPGGRLVVWSLPARIVESPGENPGLDRSAGSRGVQSVRVLVACEFSAIVRNAFIRRGHDATSCDLIPSEDPDGGPHHVGDVLQLLKRDPYWDLMIAHPECTYLTRSGRQWLFTGTKTQSRQERWRLMHEACDFFMELMNQKGIKSFALENPRMHDFAREIIEREFNFSIQPWEHGHREIKETCFWTSPDLPPLKPTNIVGPPPDDWVLKRHWARVHRANPGPNRWKERSRTLPGIADAIAEQWGANIR